MERLGKHALVCCGCPVSAHTHAVDRVARRTQNFLAMPQHNMHNLSTTTHCARQDRKLLVATHAESVCDRDCQLRLTKWGK